MMSKILQRSSSPKSYSARLGQSFSLRTMSTIPSWANFDPFSLGQGPVHAVSNLVDGKWTSAKNQMEIPNPMDKTKQPIFTIPDTQPDELQPFIDSLRKVPKTGLHNPLKNPERYVQYGEISRKVSIKTDFGD